MHALLSGLLWSIGYLFCSFSFSVEKQKILRFYFLSLFLVSFMGGKLFFYLTYPYLKYSFWPFLMGGGLVFNGAFLFALFFTFFFQQKFFLFSEEDLKKMISLFLLLHVLGRLGCLYVGCCQGSIGGISLVILEMIVLLFLFFCLRGISFFNKASFFYHLGAYFFCYGFFRLVGDFFRTGGERISFSPSQYLSCVMLLAGMVLFFKRPSEESFFP